MIYTFLRVCEAWVLLKGLMSTSPAAIVNKVLVGGAPWCGVEYRHENLANGANRSILPQVPWKSKVFRNK